MKIQNPLYFFIGQIPFVCSFVRSFVRTRLKFPKNSSVQNHFFNILLQHHTHTYMLISSSALSPVTFDFAYCRYFCSFSIRSIRFSQYENSKPLVFFHRPNSVRNLFVRPRLKFPKTSSVQNHFLNIILQYYCPSHGEFISSNSPSQSSVTF